MSELHIYWSWVELYCDTTFNIFIVHASCKKWCKAWCIFRLALAFWISVCTSTRLLVTDWLVGLREPWPNRLLLCLPPAPTSNKTTNIFRKTKNGIKGSEIAVDWSTALTELQDKRMQGSHEYEQDQDQHSLFVTCIAMQVHHAVKCTLNCFLFYDCAKKEERFRTRWLIVVHSAEEELTSDPLQ